MAASLIALAATQLLGRRNQQQEPGFSVPEFRSRRDDPRNRLGQIADTMLRPPVPPLRSPIVQGMQSPILSAMLGMQHAPEEEEGEEKPSAMRSFKQRATDAIIESFFQRLFNPPQSTQTFSPPTFR